MHDSNLVLSCAAVRRIDELAIKSLGMPGLVLMENAGRGIAELLLREGPCQRVLIGCGPGNNGGDGFVIARHLDNAGIAVDVVLACNAARLSSDASQNLAWLQQTTVRVHRPTRNEQGVEQLTIPTDRTGFDWVVDALLGTGSHGVPRGLIADCLEILKGTAGRKLAVDLPSGLDATTGLAAPSTFRADVTATLVARKPGLLAPSAAAWVGRIEVLGIGIPSRLLQTIVRDECTPLTEA